MSSSACSINSTCHFARDTIPIEAGVRTHRSSRDPQPKQELDYDATENQLPTVPAKAGMAVVRSEKIAGSE